MKLIVGVSGASGAVMGFCLLEALKKQNCESILVVTKTARLVWESETKRPFSVLKDAADVSILKKMIWKQLISSGSFYTDGMVVIPCSMKTLAGIAVGYTDNLLLRAADVCLKENRRVVLVPREMPFGRVHIRNLKEASDLGCVIVPPVLTFYNRPQTMEEQINHVIGKILLQFGMQHDSFKAWNGREP